MESAHRFINKHFGLAGGPVTRIPAQADDDDVRLTDYLLEAADLAPWLEPIGEWGKSRLHVAMRSVLQDEASIGLAASYNLADQVFSLMNARGETGGAG